MRVYLAGVISNGGTLPAQQVKRNLAIFQAAEEMHLHRKHSVANPTSIHLIEGSTWSDYMRVTIPMMLTCDTIHLLPGWYLSKGARLEFDIASELGLTILEA